MAPPRPLASANQDLITALQRQNIDLKFTINNARTTILNTADNALAKVLVTVGGAVAGLKAEFEMKRDREGLKCLADIVTKSTRAVGVARGELGAVRAALEGVGLTVEEWKENPVDADVGYSAAEKRKFDLEDDTVDLDLNPRGEKRIRSLSDELEEGEVLSRQGSDHEMGIGLLDPRVWGAGRNTWDIGTQTPADWLLLPTEEEEGFIGLPRNFEKWLQQSAQPLQVNKSDEDKYIPIKAGRPQAGLAAIQVPLQPVAMMQEPNLKPMPTLGRKWTNAFLKHTMTSEEKRWIISMFEFRDMDDRSIWIGKLLSGYRNCRDAGATETVADLERRLRDRRK